MKTRRQTFFFVLMAASFSLVMVACGNTSMKKETVSLTGAICVGESGIVSLETEDQKVECGKLSDGWSCRDSRCFRLQRNVGKVSSALVVGETQVNPTTKSRGPCVPLTLVACCNEEDGCTSPDGSPFVGRWICAPEYINEHGWVHTSAESMPCGAGQECSEVGVFPNLGLCQDIPSCVSHEDCDDNNQCTQDSCVDGRCENISMIGESCDDNDPCTTGDTCVVASSTDTTLVCRGLEKNCDDSNPCTIDSCDIATGECVYTQLEDGTVCNDGNPCTIEDVCQSGSCIGKEKPCNDANPCTLDSCDEESGECINTPVADSTVCDDGNECTLEDVCEEGFCVGTEKNCDDSNPCTIDSCNPLSGECGYTNVPDGTDCSSVSSAGRSICIAGTCVNDWCQATDEQECCIKPSGSQHQVGICECDLAENSDFGVWVISTSCGMYEDGKACINNAEGKPTCIGGCTPVCEGKVCGDDGCGGSCGTCQEGVCNAQGTSCVECLEDSDCDEEESCIANICQERQCTTNEDCPEGQFCGGSYCYVIIDKHGMTGKGQSGANSGPLPDGTPDNWDDDGDCYCEVLPCLGTVADPEDCPNGLFGGDCDDTPTGYYNHPGAFDWPHDNFDNDCDGEIDEG